MFNLQGSEIIVILLIALVVLGPEKLPGAIRKATKTYAEFRKMSNSFQSEFKSVIDEPMREMRETADLLKDAADPMKIAEDAEREAERHAEAERKEREKNNRPPQQRSDAPRPSDRREPKVPVADDALESDDFADPVDPVVSDAADSNAAVVENSSAPDVTENIGGSEAAGVTDDNVSATAADAIGENDEANA